MINFVILITTYLLSNNNAFQNNNLYRRKQIINSPMMINDYYEDLNLIHKFKYYLQKDNYNDVIKNVLDNKISKILINTDYKELVTVDNLPKDNIPYIHYHISDINPIILPNLVEKTSESHIPIYFVNFRPEIIANIEHILSILATIVSYSLPIFIFLSLFSSLRNLNKPPSNMNRMNNNTNGNNIFNMIPNFQKKDTDNFIKPNVSFSNWAGSPEVIDECKEVISYVKNKEKYKLIGADMPKGILLEGPPGTGKTLLAKAIATETDSTFISISGSEFVELFVGMGALRVRELFNSARKNRPCILFIDEIDAVGRQRGAGANMANDEREQTLNQLLYEMDGFNNNDDILVIAATNRKDVLDQALLRPGRFDRIIRVPLPDKESRVKILEFYFHSKQFDKQVDISSIAELTDGFSGAQLKNLINEAAILSIRNNYTVIQEKYIYDAFEKSIVGLIKTNAKVGPLTRERVAIHESGHSLLVLLFAEYFNFQKASIQPTYNGAGGYTLFSEKPEIKESGLYTKDFLKKRLIIAMGGKAAESIYYGNDFVSLGAIQDLKQANNIAKRMVGNFGMGDKLEVFFNENIEDNSNPFLGEKYSENTKYLVDKETLNLVKDAYNEAKVILTKNKELLIEFSELLQNNTIVSNRDLQTIKINT